MSKTFPHSTPTRIEAERLLAEALDTGRLSRFAGEKLGAGLADECVREPVLEAAFESKCRGKGDRVSVSKNVFIPLTNLCRDRCGYCTFAKLPGDPAAKTWNLEEVADAAHGARRAGCIEALFCLGDKPEKAYRAHRDWLAARGHASTAEYLVEGCRVAFELGMLPHTNAGILSPEQMTALRPWNASMGLMLETTSARLRGKGHAHHVAPDKDPEVRLRMHREAGELRIPFTSGLLLGIGENVSERVDTLLAIRDAADAYGHIQEVIVQPFHAKPTTPMRGVQSLTDALISGWVALARLAMGPEANVQAPPNLAPEALELLLRSGLNDWGGVSPVTVDFINPEAPWPELAELRRRTEAAGQRLIERLPVYPQDLLHRKDLFDPQVHAAALRLADGEGWARSGVQVEAA